MDVAPYLALSQFSAFLLGHRIQEEFVQKRQRHCQNRKERSACLDFS